MRGLSGTPTLSSFVERVPPPRSSSAPKVNAPMMSTAPEEVAEIAEELIQGDAGEIAKALLAQSSAITSLVTQMASSSGDILQDMSGSTHVVSSRGAAGRVKLQQELAAQRGTFFQMIFQQMSRRMQPALTADLMPKQLADRGVTATQYLERFGGFGRVREIGQIAWQVAIALDHMQQGNDVAARDALALLMVCLEQTSLDGGNMQIGLLLALTEDPPASLFSNRSLALGSRPRAFAPMADQRWVTTSLQYLKELDTIQNRRSEVTAPSSKGATAKEDSASPKKKPKGKSKGSPKKQAEEEG